MSYKRIKEYLKFNSDLWAFPLIFFAIPFIQELFYWFDPTAGMLGIDYLFDLVIAGLYIMAANFFSLGFLRFVVKPMYDYRRKIEKRTYSRLNRTTGKEEEIEKDMTLFALDWECHEYQRILIWLAYYLVPFISFLLVACSFHAVK